MEEADHPFGPFHVPQQCIRDKLRFNPPNNNSHHYDNLSLPPPPPQSPYFALSYPSSTAPPPSSTKFPCFADERTGSVSTARLLPESGCLDAMAANGGLNLSLATNNRGGGQLSGSMMTSPRWKPVEAAPVGPFTGYASILSRSRFLKPAQEMLEEFCGAYRGRVADSAGNVVALDADSAAWGENSGGAGAGGGGFVDRCGNAGLISMLHEVYRRNRLYCQQMHSAVTSFETVAGIGNAAPFLCLAIQSMSKHFHCLKNAILDHIRFTKKVHNYGEMNKKGSGPTRLHSPDPNPKPDPVLHNQKLVQNSSFLQNPVWRSQRGFPDKAVAVLRTWLFENFLHPYPTDSDKQMLAQHTGLSRNQVSNWFTNARVRLWKPMVEEIHTLEKRSELPTKVENRGGFSNMLANHYYSANPCRPKEGSQVVQIQSIPKVQDDDQPRLTISGVPQAEQNKEQSVMPCANIPTDQHMYVSGSLTGRHKISNSTVGSNQDNSGGLAWIPREQGIPFWLGK